MSRKHKELPVIKEVTITDVAAEGKAIVKSDDIVIFTQYTVPGAQYNSCNFFSPCRSGTSQAFFRKYKNAANLAFFNFKCTYADNFILRNFFYSFKRRQFYALDLYSFCAYNDVL